MTAAVFCKHSVDELMMRQNVFTRPRLPWCEPGAGVQRLLIGAARSIRSANRSSAAAPSMRARKLEFNSTLSVSFDEM